MFCFIFEKIRSAQGEKYLCRAMLKINPFALPKAKEKMLGSLFQVLPITNKNVILSTTVLFFHFFWEIVMKINW